MGDLLTDNGMYRRQMRDAFAELRMLYSDLRCYVADKYGEWDPRENVIAWMREKQVAVGADRTRTEGVPEVERIEMQFWEGWHGLAELILEEEDVADQITNVTYEEALVNEEPWAIETHEARRERKEAES